MTNPLIRLTTVPDNSTDDRHTVFVPLSAIAFIHAAIPAAETGKDGPLEACTGVYMCHNGKALFVKETAEDIAAALDAEYP